MPISVFIGLGANLQNPKDQVERALVELSNLPESSLKAVSPLYRSRALGPGDQPDYINAVACLNTALSPIALLDTLQSIEQSHHRLRIERWGPRTLDLDILLYGEDIIELPRLTVPHPYLKQRNFVLFPLYDIAPDLVLPCGTLLKDLIAQSNTEGLDNVQA